MSKTLPVGLSMDIEEVSLLLTERGWAEKNAGNLSIDITDELRTRSSGKHFILNKSYRALGNRCFLITPSGSRFRDIARGSRKILLVIRIDKDGTGYEILNYRAGIRPTSELDTHLSIHNLLREKNSGYRVVLHTHPTELITLSHIKDYHTDEKLSRLLYSAHPEVYINLADKIGFAKYSTTGTIDLAEATIRCIERGKSLVLWERHGVLSIEKDVISAFDHIDIANKAAEISLRLFMMGKKPIPLNKSQIQELRRIIEA